MGIKQYITNNKEATEEIKKKEIKRFLETNDNENTNIQKIWDSAKAFLRGRFIAIQSYLRSRKASSRQPNSTSKETGKRRTKNL